MPYEPGPWADFIEGKNIRYEWQLDVGWGEYTNQAGTHLGLIAMYLELGTRRMPSRPFLTNARIRASRDPKVQELWRIDRYFHPLFGPTKEGLAELGKLLVGHIKRELVDNASSYAPLAESTVERKGHDTIFFDTGQLIFHLHYKVVRAEA